MQILTVAALIVIGILLFELIIFSHEFGHFITAKLSGVKVNEFKWIKNIFIENNSISTENETHIKIYF